MTTDKFPAESPYRRQAGPNDGLRGIPDKLDVAFTDENPEGFCFMEGFSPYHWYYMDHDFGQRWAYDSKLGLHGGGIDGEIYQTGKGWFLALAYDLSRRADASGYEPIGGERGCVFSTLDEARNFIEIEVAKFWKIYDPDKPRWEKD